MQQEGYTAEIAPWMRPVAAGTKYADGEIVRIGKQMYERDLQAVLDTPENQGRLVGLDIESGDYVMGRDTVGVLNDLRTRRPESVIYLLRVGRRAAVSLGGGNVRSR